ncbi:hypothetical protein GDO81_021293 [Engystomops pustulosus]|uniref:Uncharacterized protein n=1 Tax=Engystomops pustulosus TaxID=76066 RepID=A0AAV6YW48_ENGPU|nr:hypothetical protein GDO81_021293 [Engystomops pustulosus]
MAVAMLDVPYGIFRRCWGSLGGVCYPLPPPPGGDIMHSINMYMAELFMLSENILNFIIRGLFSYEYSVKQTTFCVQAPPPSAGIYYVIGCENTTRGFGPQGGLIHICLLSLTGGTWILIDEA